MRLYDIVFSRDSNSQSPDSNFSAQLFELNKSKDRAGKGSSSSADSVLHHFIILSFLVCD